MSHPPSGRSLRTTAAILLAALTGMGAIAATGANTSQKVTAAPNPATQTTPPAKVRFIESSSTESPKARKKRLKVECKGRPNAGMCLGHTR